jgi:competence protein ComEA
MDRVLESSGRSPAPRTPDGPARADGGWPLGGAQRLGLLVLAAAALLIGVLPQHVGRRGERLRPAEAPRTAEAPFQVNVNTAEWPVLCLVPGLGEKLSQRIVAYRQARGPLRSLDELVAVSGIGPVKLASLRPYLFLGEAQEAAEKRHRHDSLQAP